jgi:cytochrome c1
MTAWKLLSLGVAFLILPACGADLDRSAAALTGGNPVKGRAAIARYGCSSCHTISGVSGADALVGPPLDRIGSQTYIAGVLENTPDNMIRWILDPPAADPRTAMPNLHVAQADARDIAGFLYTLR